ncbi:hypothetical protein PIB19_18545 [Sphingomonas sp. 7/4-4]|uniref:hypothetical protein n=1 Tax=Sphingomonas sp. 7/4-4 TaxID=3018446 RepID=UPI0022F3D573|nr:hypothetical protein [Sphingomonas sp. 7/4-4]WBY07341.1 hypothetical protein PIB19_18545 [Sphingomonas sp. 7/4-4]
MTWRSTTFRFAALVFLGQVIAAAILLAAVGAVLRARSDSDAAATAETIRGEMLATYTRGGTPALARQIELRKTEAITRNGVTLLIDRAGRRLAGNLGDWPPACPRRTIMPRFSSTAWGMSRPRRCWCELPAYPAGSGSSPVSGWKASVSF